LVLNWQGRLWGAALFSASPAGGGFLDEGGGEALIFRKQEFDAFAFRGEGLLQMSE